MKNSSIVPVHRKGDKQIADNYRLISLLPIQEKIFGRVLFNSVFKCCKENNLLSENQSVHVSINFIPLPMTHMYPLIVTNDIVSEEFF